jgi:hypothetical protein
MMRRVGHWAAVGLMYKLSKVTDSILKERLKARPKEQPLSLSDSEDQAKRTDLKLSLYLRTLGANENLKNILKNYEYVIPSSDADPTDPKVVLPHLQRKCLKSPSSLYDEETFIEFHHLFVAILLCYAKSLQELDKEYEKRKKGNDLLNLMIKKISDYQKGVERETKKDIQIQRRAPDSNTRNPMPTLKSFGTEAADDSEERKEIKMKGLEVLLDEELSKSLLPEAEMDSEERNKFLRELKSCLQRTSNTMPSSPAEAMRNAEEKKMLESYLDRKLSAVVPTIIREAIDPIREKAIAVLTSCRILHTILFSRAFQDHIKFLVSSQVSLIPSDGIQELDAYRTFSEKNRLPWQKSFSYKPFSEDRANDCDGVLDSDGSDAEDGIYDNDPEGDQVPFKILYDEEIVLAIQGWLKLFVQHLQAKNVLESFARDGSKGIPIEIKVYGISPPTKPLTMPDWSTLVEIIHSSLDGVPDEEREEIIEVFKAHFPSKNNNTSTAPSRHGLSGKGKRIFSVVGDIATGKAKTRDMYYNMHCEVVLAGLVAASKVSPGALTRYANEKVVEELKVGLGVSFSILQPRQLTTGIGSKGSSSFEALLPRLLGLFRYLAREERDVQGSRPPFHRLSCAAAHLDQPRHCSRVNQTI